MEGCAPTAKAESCWAAQCAQLTGDATRVAQPTLDAYGSVDDAIAALLPYHALAADDPEEADLEEAAAAAAPLQCSRYQAWLDMCTRKTVEYASTSAALVRRFEVARGEASRRHGEERYLAARLLLDDAAQRNTAAVAAAIPPLAPLKTDGVS